MATTAQEAAKYGITFSTGSAATPQGVANAAANGIVNNVQQAPSGGSVAPAMQNTGSGVATPVTPGQPINTTQPQPTPTNPLPTVNPAVTQTALTNAQASGPAPQSAGEARGVVQDALNTAQNTPTFYKPDPNSAQVVNAQGEKLSYDQYLAQGGKADFSNTKVGNPPTPTTNTPLHPIEQLLAEDPGYQQLLADRAEYNSTANQSKSLLDFYNQAVKDAGIPAINAELINTKNIIDGTEDDIRNEVKAASGFATDSQVLALAQARNKSLIKNYNTLLDTKNMAMENIQNMTNLAGQDRAFALQSISQKMQFDQQINDYRDKFVNSAKEGYQNYINAVGYTGLYNSLASDPQSLVMVERTMGLPAGTIQQAAAQEHAIQQTKANQQNFENSIKLSELDISKQKLGIDRAQLGVSQGNLSVARYNAETSRINALKDIPAPGQIDDKTLAKIQASPDYKTISGLLPAVQAIKTYEDLVKKEGTYAFPGSAAKGQLQSAYGNALSAWKTLAGLGALSGADFALAENAIPSLGLFKSNTKATAQLQSSLDNGVQQAENLTKRLTQLYPDAGSLLEQQLDSIKVSAYPDKFKVGPDGQVYEITH